MSSALPAPPAARKRLLTVVAPACDEEEVVAQFCACVFAEVGKRPAWRLELLIVDDGSADATAQIARNLRAENPRVGLLSFSRNFGHEAAMLAGLDRARGDAVAVMDSDLQHPPELLPEMLDKLDEGFDIVNPRRSREDSEGFWKKILARIWYRLLPLLSRGGPTPPPDVTDFRLASRRAVDAFLQLRESGRYARGLFAWIGFPAAEIEYRRAPRAGGEANTPCSNWSRWRWTGSPRFPPRRCAGRFTWAGDLGAGAGLFGLCAVCHFRPRRGDARLGVHSGRFCFWAECSWSCWESSASIWRGFSPRPRSARPISSASSCRPNPAETGNDWRRRPVILVRRAKPKTPRAVSLEAARSPEN